MYINSFAHGNQLVISLYIENEPAYSVGRTMCEMNRNIDMNGYNWEAYLNCYLKKYYPELLEGLHTDPESGMYTAIYEKDDRNQVKFEKFQHVIMQLIEEPNLNFSFLKEYAEDIEWE